MRETGSHWIGKLLHDLAARRQRLLLLVVCSGLPPIRALAAKLKNPLDPTITWSWTTTSTRAHACSTCLVTLWSYWLGFGSPLGWLWTRMTAAALTSSARRTTSRGCTPTLFTVPTLSTSSATRRLQPSRNRTRNVSRGRPAISWAKHVTTAADVDTIGPRSASNRTIRSIDRAMCLRLRRTSPDTSTSPGSPAPNPSRTRLSEPYLRNRLSVRSGACSPTRSLRIWVRMSASPIDGACAACDVRSRKSGSPAESSSRYLGSRLWHARPSPVRVAPARE
jgi:hypothetical protein